MRFEDDVFNSSIFKMKMANIICDDNAYDENDVKKAMDEAKKRKYQHLSVKVDIADKGSLNAFLGCGFNLVDTQIMYEIPLNANSTEKNTGITRPYDISDKDRILEIAKKAYTIDRFHSDPQLPDDRCDVYYEQWAKNLCEGLADKVFVIDTDENTSGYITLQYNDRTARVILAAIDSRYQGNGYFTAIMTDVIWYLSNDGFDCLFYGTQLGNIPVLRTVGRLNGIPKFSNHVLHKVI